MLLTLTTTYQPATDLGYLLHKHPQRFQTFDLSFGQAHVFYPEVGAERTTAALLLDVDPVGMVRGRGRTSPSLLGHYVNDRPYAASSFMSVAISQVFGTALAGRCRDREELAAQPIPLVARIDVLPVRAGEGFVHRVFEPLGYSVDAERHPLDEQFPEWGPSAYVSLTIAGTKTLAELLTHLYVLIPVFDNEKHYFVGEDELEKLLAKGGRWLASHPEKEQITRRFLKHRSSLYREALARLVEDEPAEAGDEGRAEDREETSLERSLSLNEQRRGAVLAALRASGARNVLDLGCGEGALLRELVTDRQFERIVGMDVSIRSLEAAQKRLKLERLPEKQAERVNLIHGSLIYRDRRLEGFDAAAVVEVIEHLDPPRLGAFERVLFEFARPKTIVLTTPNREYNVMWPALRVRSEQASHELGDPTGPSERSESLSGKGDRHPTSCGGTDINPQHPGPSPLFRTDTERTVPSGPVVEPLRHPDHRFEWTRREFEEWANRVAGEHGYSVRFQPVGPVVETVGPPTQMGVFERV